MVYFEAGVVSRGKCIGLFINELKWFFICVLNEFLSLNRGKIMSLLYDQSDLHEINYRWKRTNVFCTWLKLIKKDFMGKCFMWGHIFHRCYSLQRNCAIVYRCIFITCQYHCIEVKPLNLKQWQGGYI